MTMKRKRLTVDEKIKILETHIGKVKITDTWVVSYNIINEFIIFCCHLHGFFLLSLIMAKKKYDIDVGKFTCQNKDCEMYCKANTRACKVCLYE